MKRLFVSVLALVSALAIAQFVAAPKQIADLNWMVGSWKGTTKMNVQGMEMSMASTMKVTQYGSFLKFDSSNMVEGVGNMSEFGFLSWDEKNKYMFVNYTDWATTPRVEKGDMKEGSLVLISDPWDLGEEMGGVFISRSTLSKMGDKQMKIVIDFKNGDAWEKAGEAIFTKE